MGRGIGFFMDVNFMVLGQLHPEFLFNCFSWFRENTFAKVTVFASSGYERICCVNGFLH